MIKQATWSAIAICIFCALLLSACAGDPPIQPVTITGSDMCRIQPHPLSWDIADTAPTIKDVRQFNARWYSRCGKKAKGAPVS